MMIVCVSIDDCLINRNMFYKLKTVVFYELLVAITTAEKLW